MWNIYCHEYQQLTLFIFLLYISVPTFNIQCGRAWSPIDSGSSAWHCHAFLLWIHVVCTY